MENFKIQKYDNPHLGNINVIVAGNGELFFVASDVATGMGYRDANSLTRILDEDEKGTQILRTLGGNQRKSVITESGFYHAAMKSREPKARLFRKWVTTEVLPQIRMTGGYIPVKEEDDEKTILSKALLICQRTIDQKNALIEEQKPKVEYCDDVLMSEDCVTTTQVAKHFGLSAKSLNEKLHELGIQFKLSGQWHLYAHYSKFDFTRERTSPYYDTQGVMHTSVLTVWTERGKRFLSELISNDYDVRLALQRIK